MPASANASTSVPNFWLTLELDLEGFVLRLQVLSQRRFGGLTLVTGGVQLALRCCCKGEVVRHAQIGLWRYLSTEDNGHQGVQFEHCHLSLRLKNMLAPMMPVPDPNRLIMMVLPHSARLPVIGSVCVVPCIQILS